MEFLGGLDIQSFGFVALATFGAVSAVNFWRKLTTQQNFLLSVLFAFIFGFVPADLGNELANRIKEALALGVSLNGAYQFASGIAKKFGGSSV